MDKIKAGAMKLAILLQKFTVATLLCFVYFIGFGLTRVALLLVGSRVFAPWKVNKNSESYWQESPSTANDPRNHLSQV